MSSHAAVRLSSDPSASPGPGAWSQAFDLPGGEVGCLLLHGFTATPQEMRYLGERLHGWGYSVRGVRVAGHATSVEDLERSHWRDWYESVDSSLQELRRRSARVVVIGQSMGSLLALSLASRRPEQIDGLVVLAPAVVLQRQWLQGVRPLLPLVSRFAGERFRYLAKGRSDIADPEAHPEREVYDRIPVRALHQLLLLQRDARRQLPRIKQPTLVVHARQDHTCSPRGVDQLRRRLGGPVEVVVLERSYHVVSVDFEREQVAEHVARFASRYGSPAGTKAAPACDAAS